MRPAPFASPNRRRESGGSILLLSQPPSRPVVFEQRQLNYLATITWALKCSQPGHALAYRIQPVLFQFVRQFLRTHDSELAPVGPGGLNKPTTAIPEISHKRGESHGRPNSGSQSPMPTYYSRCPFASSSASRWRANSQRSPRTVENSLLPTFRKTWTRARNSLCRGLGIRRVRDCYL